MWCVCVCVPMETVCTFCSIDLLLSREICGSETDISVENKERMNNMKRRPMAAGRESVEKDSGRKGNEKVKGQRLKALQRRDMLQYMEVFLSQKNQKTCF